MRHVYITSISKEAQSSCSWYPLARLNSAYFCYNMTTSSRELHLPSQLEGQHVQRPEPVLLAKKVSKLCKYVIFLLTSQAISCVTLNSVFRSWLFMAVGNPPILNITYPCSHCHCTSTTNTKWWTSALFQIKFLTVKHYWWSVRHFHCNEINL